MTTSIAVSPKTIRKFVKGTMFAELYDLIFEAVKDNYTYAYFADQFTAELIADAYSKFMRAGTADLIPKRLCKGEKK